MFIASQKKKENVSEYILYMWQIEDIIRTFQFDIDKIKTNIISRFQLDDEKKKQLTEWYESLIDMMRMEGVKEKGHLTDRELTEGLARAGVRVRALSEYYHDGSPDLHCLVVNYSGLKEDRLEKALGVLEEIM